MTYREHSLRFGGESSTWVDEAEFNSESLMGERFLGHCFTPNLRVQKDLLVSESPNDLATVFASFAKDISAKVETDLRVSILEKVVLELRHSIAGLAGRQAITVPIISLAPEPFELRCSIPVVVQPEGDEFAATFFDANINATGDTQTEAVDNLKDVLVSTFRRYSALGEERLGPGPRRQLAVLKTLIK